MGRDQLSVNSSSQKPLKSAPNSSTRILTGAKVIGENNIHDVDSFSNV